MLIRTGLALFALVAACAPVAEAAQKRVLLVTEARGFVHHSIPDAEAFFAALGHRSPWYEVLALGRGAVALTSRRLRGADAVVFANTSISDYDIASRLVR